MKTALLLSFLLCVGCATSSQSEIKKRDQYLLKIKTLQKERDFDGALTYFEKIASLNVKLADDFYYRYGMAIIFSGMGKELSKSSYEKAKKMFQTYLDRAGKGGKYYTAALDWQKIAEAGERGDTGTKRVVLVSPSRAQKPAWCEQPGGALMDGKRRVLRAVGLSKDLGDEAYTFNKSEGQARKQLQSVMTTYMDVFARYYRELMKGDEISSTAVEQEIARISDLITRSKYPHAQMVNRWTDPRSKTVYSLLELDLESVVKMIKGVKGLSMVLQTNVDRYAKEAHKRMSEEMKK